MTNLIEVDRLSRHFGDIKAVEDISFSVARGEVLGFLGPNGAGKSTTMKMITGFLPPTKGTARICGHDVNLNPIAVKEHIGYLPEGSPLYGEMTVLDFLDFCAAMRGFKGTEQQDAVDRVIERMELEQVVFQQADTLSKGFKRRVGLAQAIMHDPDVLILDEPTDGLDPNQKYEVRELISSMAKNKAIIISTHILEEVNAICSRCVIIAEGKLIVDKTPKELESMSNYHNAVSLIIPRKYTKDFAKLIGKVKTISHIEKIKATKNNAHLRIIPKNKASIITDISSLLQKNNITFNEISVDKGHLDDVFRQLTRPNIEETTKEKQESAPKEEA